MAAVVYQDTNYGGAFARVAPRSSRPVVLSGRRLVGKTYPNAVAPDVELDNAISSIRVEAGVIVVLADGHSGSASGGGARVLVGPRSVPDLGALGLDDKVSSLHVMRFDSYSTGHRGSGPVVLHSGYSGQGRQAKLYRGDYNESRLGSDEVRFDVGATHLRSVTVPAGKIAVLYDGPDFDEDKDAVAIAGPASVHDLDRLGLMDRVSSVRVFDTPGGAPPSPAIVVVPATPPAGAATATPTAAAPAQVVVTKASPKKPETPMWAIVLIVLLVLVLVLGGVVAGAHLNSRRAKYQSTGSTQ